MLYKHDICLIFLESIFYKASDTTGRMRGWAKGTKLTSRNY